MSEENKIIQQKVVAALNNFDWSALSEVMAEDIVESLKHDSIPKAFPDAKLTILDQIAEGDKVSMRGLFTGTHRGEPMDTDFDSGLAPFGQRYRATRDFSVVLSDNRLGLENLPGGRWRVSFGLQLRGIIG